MRNQVMMKSLLVIALVAITVGAFMLPAQKQSGRVATAGSQSCPSDESGLTLSSGLSATVIADGIDHATDAISKPNAADPRSANYARPAVGGSSTRVKISHDAPKRGSRSSN